MVVTHRSFCPKCDDGEFRKCAEREIKTFRSLELTSSPFPDKDKMRFFLCLIIALVGVATAQLGATNPVARSAGPGVLPSLPGASSTGNSAKKPESSDPWVQRKADDKKWQESYDAWKKAKDSLNAKPTDATLKSVFVKAQIAFDAANKARREADGKWNSMSQDSWCTATDSDKKHANDMKERNKQDSARGEKDRAWGKAYGDWTSARDAWKKDQGNDAKKKAYEDASQKYQDASDQHDKDMKDWTAKNQEHRKGDQVWGQGKGMPIPVDTPPSATTATTQPAPPSLRSAV